MYEVTDRFEESFILRDTLTGKMDPSLFNIYVHDVMPLINGV